LPEPSIEFVLPMDVGPDTGTDGLIPAPPISVEPSGIPTRPTVDVEGRGEAAAVLPAGPHALRGVPSPLRGEAQAALGERDLDPVEAEEARAATETVRRRCDTKSG